MTVDVEPPANPKRRRYAQQVREALKTQVDARDVDVWPTGLEGNRPPSPLLWEERPAARPYPNIVSAGQRRRPEPRC